MDSSDEYHFSSILAGC